MSARTRISRSQAVRRPGSRLPAMLPRLLRFGLTGGLAGLVQIGLLRAFESAGLVPLVANALGFLLAAQVNFIVSQVFTWADRPLNGTLDDSLGRRWRRFHAAIAGTAVLNMLVFAAARTLLPDLVASALGICVAAVANFLLADRLVFRVAKTSAARPMGVRRPTLAGQRRAA